VAFTTIVIIESSDGIPSGQVKTLNAVQKALEEAGIEFMAPPSLKRAFDRGVNLVPNPHQQLVRNQIRQAGFPYNYRQQAEQKILDTIWTICVQQRIVKNLYGTYSNKKIGSHPPQVGVATPQKFHKPLISLLF